MPENATNYHTANRFAKILATFVAAFAGCSSSTSPEKATGVSTGASVPSQRFGSFEFLLPDRWTKESVSGGLLLMAPNIENNWQANLFLEFRHDSEGRTLAQTLADLAPNLKDRKKQFREVSRKVEKHSAGFQIGTLEYTCVDQGTVLTEWEIVIEAGNKQRLFVLASSASASWAEYHPVFLRFIRSLKMSG